MQPVNNERVTGMTDQFVARLPLVRDNTGSKLQKFVHVYSQGVHKPACQSRLSVVRDERVLNKRFNIDITRYISRYISQLNSYPGPRGFS